MTKEPYLQNFADEVVKVVKGVKALTAYGVMGKYLDVEKELDNNVRTLKKQLPEYEVIIM